MNPRPLVSAVLLFHCALGGTALGLESVIVGKSGQVEAKFTGPAWEAGPGGLSAEGSGRLLMARNRVGPGDFRLRAVLCLERLDGSAASLMIGESQFGFDGRNGGLFLEGPLFEGTAGTPVRLPETLKAGVPFTLEVIRRDGTARFLIDGREVHRKSPWNEAVGRIGLRPWRNRMSVSEFVLEGDLVQPGPPIEPLFLSGFAGGKEGYHTFRIPALASTARGTLLAFCEGRKNSSGDSGDIDLVMKRSSDEGRSWSETRVLWDDGPNTCGNPCVLVDRETGVIFLFSTWNRGDDHEAGIIAGTSKDTRRVFVLRSDDDGLTWSRPADITADVKSPDWSWYATGPGSGIRIEHGPHKGRLVVPCDHIGKDSRQYRSHVIYSDDHGHSWRTGGVSPEHQVNECEVVELSGGNLMLNMRSYLPSKRMRQTAVSGDGGLTWKDQRPDPNLIEPICQAAVERYRWADGSTPGVILFSNPASTRARVDLTLRASMDDGLSWPLSKLIHAGPGGYSDLALLTDGRIACLYEAGEDNIAESIVLSTTSLGELKGTPASR